MENLKKLRESRNLTQKKLADELGLTQQAYANYEAGRREPDFDTLKLIAKYFSTTVDFLLDIDCSEPHSFYNNAFSVNLETALKLDNKNPYDFVIEWYKICKHDKSANLYISNNSLDNFYCEFYNWLNNMSIPSPYEQSLLKEKLCYSIDFSEYNPLIISDLSGANDVNDILKKIKNSDVYKKAGISSYEILIWLERDYKMVYNSISVIENEDFPNLQKLYDKLNYIIKLINNTMISIDEARYNHYLDGEHLLYNKYKMLMMERSKINITKREYFKIFFNDLNIKEINNIPITDLTDEFLNNFYLVLMDQIKNNQFLYAMISNDNLSDMIAFTGYGYDYAKKSFTDVNKAKQYFKSFLFPLNRIKEKKKFKSDDDIIKYANDAKKEFYDIRERKKTETLNYYFGVNNSNESK